MNRLTMRSATTLALALVLLLGSVPAYGATTPATVHTDVVPSHAMVGGLDLYSLDATAARAAIASASIEPTYATLAITGDGHTIKVSPNSAIVVDVEAMLDQAYAATDTVTPFELTPVLAVTPSVVSGWSAKLDKLVYHPAVNAKYARKYTKLIVVPEKVGHSVKKVTTSGLITTRLNSIIASGGSTPSTVTAALSTLKPAVTHTNIGKAIIVVRHHFLIKLYNHGKIEKTYKCAIGMPAHPTPLGKWKVTGKVKNPAWHNPGSAWAANMPAYIPPGPNNPLGTRAIYLSAPGIRFHGTAKWWSIGHAASHGCMRMRRADVEDFYPRVPVGITVWIVR